MMYYSLTRASCKTEENVYVCVCSVVQNKEVVVIFLTSFVGVFQFCAARM